MLEENYTYGAFSCGVNYWTPASESDQWLQTYLDLYVLTLPNQAKKITLTTIWVVLTHSYVHLFMLLITTQRLINFKNILFITLVLALPNQAKKITLTTIWVILTHSWTKAYNKIAMSHCENYEG
jgi:hypothetical protein